MTFENLASELKMEIFSYLPFKDLKNASLICKSWREFILGSPKLLRKFELIVSFESSETKEVICKTSVHELLNKFGHAFSFVTLIGKFTKNEFKRMLNATQNVNQLNINNITLTTSTNKSHCNEMLFPNLKILILKRSSNMWKITNFLKNANIEELHIDFWTHEKKKLDKEYIDWFYRLNCLKHLKVDDREWGNSLKLFSVIQVENLQFKLKTFAIKCSEITGFKNDDLFKFLQHQDELEKISLSAGNVIFSSFIFKYVFFEKQHLKDLDILIYARHVTTHNEVLAMGRTNLNLTALRYADESFDDDPSRIEVFKEIVRIFPNLKKLTLQFNMLDGSILKFLSETLEHLKNLSIGWMKGGSFTHMKFKNLKELKIDAGTMTVEDWTVLLSQNPNVEKLFIDNFILEADGLQAIVQNGANIKHLTINSGVYTKNLLQIISKHKKLTNLVLRYETLKQLNEELANEFSFTLTPNSHNARNCFCSNKMLLIDLNSKNPELLNNFYESPFLMKVV